MSDIEVIPCLSDNYAYLVRGPAGVVLVDAPDSAPIHACIETAGARLTHILVTHDDDDHTGGVTELKKLYGAEVIAPAGSRVPLVDRFVDGGAVLEIAGLRAEVLWTPGHSAVHAAFYFPALQSVFTGDSLFGAGCGRLFGNPPELMFASLQKLGALPDSTRVYFGHEYTRSNLRFASTVEPQNPEIAQRLAALKPISAPSTIALEKATNPFLRARDAAEFAERRRRKDAF